MPETNSYNSHSDSDNTKIQQKQPVHKYLFRRSNNDDTPKKVYSVGFIHVYIPYLCAFILSLINKVITDNGGYNGLGDNTLLIVKCIIYLITFIVPCIVFCKMKRLSIHKELSIHRFSFSYTTLIAISFLLLTVVIATGRIAIDHFFPTAGSEIPIQANKDNAIGVILAYAIFPAICEELFLRGLLQNEISKTAGAAAGIIVSSLAFALIHQELRYFLIYFVSGIILAVVSHITNSVIPSVILHTLNNLFSITFSARISFIASERTGNTILIAVLTLILLLLLIFFLKLLENICIKKAYVEDMKKSNSSEEDSQKTHRRRMYYRTPFKMSSPSGYTLHKALRVIFSPAMIISFVLFMFAVI